MAALPIPYLYFDMFLTETALHIASFARCLEVLIVFARYVGVFYPMAFKHVFRRRNLIVFMILISSMAYEVNGNCLRSYSTLTLGYNIVNTTLLTEECDYDYDNAYYLLSSWGPLLFCIILSVVTVIKLHSLNKVGF
ncbi:unnamed protein product [Bursaphelenchus xylophilus]|uniref:(pine wood nematode) hypothetical protein n=1 Tax=Bursaphelenchus xylophilus TaxID=6326 RepID=A0A7I8WKR7_BURXY|nr:unnamed protein product [Bursaphelenchus xylophilus]CAG9106695.1 unnamed protein product [Bursaphelenchus xylophilus]